jgi:tol-pal system protein YbgF
MKYKLLLISMAGVALAAGQAALARDIQLRPGNDDSSGSSVSTGSRPAATTSTRKLTTEERIARLERILDSQGLVDMLTRLDNLQNEIQSLRGELELQSHQLEEIKQRQRDLYVDIDRRLLRLERNAPGGSTAPSAGTTPAVPQKGKTPAATAQQQTTTTVATAAGEQKAYQQAFDLLRDLRYDQAVTAFRNFLAKYPKGRYAHIAQYWIGEANYAQRKFKDAIADYQKLIDNYPGSPKLAEAMLKIGYSQYELKQYKEAETTLKQLIKSYPGTTEAGQAQNLLQKIRLKH